jgi:hypothetical protein
MTTMTTGPEVLPESEVIAGWNRPLEWWKHLVVVCVATVCFPVLLTSLPDELFLRRAHVQRWLVIISVGLLQFVRCLFAWLVWQFAWRWLAWVVGVVLILRVWNTANAWWSLIEDPATWSIKKNRAGGTS